MILTLAQSTAGAAPPMALTWFDVILSVVKILVVIVALQGTFAYATWFERRVLARMQWRLGPNRTGPFGLLQPVADGLKVLFKEQLIPAQARTFLYILAPCISLAIPLTVFAVVPFGAPTASAWNFFGIPVQFAWWIADINVGVLYILGMTSLAVYGIVLAGWSSGNHYALLGAIRSAAQVISYELAMGMALLSPLLLSGLFTKDGLGTLSLRELVLAQETGGWFVFYMPVAFAIYWISGIAETNRAPFDLPEAEQELIAGYFIEYSGMRFAMFFMAEYIAMLTMSAIGTTVFLGGAGSPFLLPWTIFGLGEPPAALWPLTMPGPWWFALKIFFFMFVFVWLRATFPRFRYDQLMRIGWQLLLPLGILNVTVTSVFVAMHDPMGFTAGLTKGLVLGTMVLLIALLALLGAARRTSAARVPARAEA